MSEKIFSVDDNLTEEYQQYFNKSGVIGYYKSPYEVEPKKKTYHLYLENGEITHLGTSLEEVDKRLQEIYYADQTELDFRQPIEKAIKITPKRKSLLEAVSKITTWARGTIAKIAAKLGRKIGAVRQMLSVLTKKGLLVRIRRGQYALSNEQHIAM